MIIQFKVQITFQVDRFNLNETYSTHFKAQKFVLGLYLTRFTRFCKD